MLSSQLEKFWTEKLVPGLTYWEVNRKLSQDHWHFFLEPQLSLVLFNNFFLFSECFPPFLALHPPSPLKLLPANLAAVWYLRYSPGMVQHQIRDLFLPLGVIVTLFRCTQHWNIKLLQKVVWTILVEDPFCRLLTSPSDKKYCYCSYWNKISL